MPKVINTHCPVLLDVRARANCCAMYVLTESHGAYKVYMGVCGLEDSRDDVRRKHAANAIATSGLPLTKEHAAQVFPFVAFESYRA